MYPNSALTAGQLALIAVVAVVCLATWIGGVFVAASEPPRDSGAGAGRAGHPAGQVDRVAEVVAGALERRPARDPRPQAG